MNSIVSVIVPVCNSADYLDECLNSITRQTYEYIEIICVNDGSTDESLDILERHQAKDSRIRIISQENSGYGKAMNVGLNAAKGKWIAFVESDDYILSNMYKELVEIAEKNSLDFIKTNLCRFYGEGNERFFQTTQIIKNQKLLNVILNPSEDPQLLNAVMNNVTGIFRREFLDANKIRFNESPGASFQDNGFWFQTFIYGSRAMFADKNYYMVRRDNPNSSVKSKKKIYCMRDEYKYILSILEKDQKIFDLFIYQWCKKLFSNCVGTLNRIDYRYREEFLITMSKDFNYFENKGWIDLCLFNPRERKMLLSIMHDPVSYNVDFINNRINKAKKTIKKNSKKINSTAKKLEALQGSYSLKIGRFLKGKKQ